jgi:hypothetical protein
VKYEFTIHSPQPFTFTVDMSAEDCDRLELFLIMGSDHAIERRELPYQPEPEAPWPIGPTLEDM